MSSNRKLLKNAFERVIIITLLSIFLAMFCLSVINDIYSFVSPRDSVSLYIQSPTPLYDLSLELSRNGIINNPSIFYLYVRSKGREQKLESFTGEAILTKNMSYREIMLALS